MRRIAIIPVLVLAAACADRGIVEPVDVLPGDVAAAAVPNPALGGWEFEVVATYNATLGIGDVRLAAHNIHYGDVVNEFRLTGDMEGWYYWVGKYNMNLKAERGKSILHEGVLITTSPGTGTFECQGSSTIVDYPAAWVQSGTLHSCTGTGDYEGKKMKARVTNEANPALNTYIITGVIY